MPCYHADEDEEGDRREGEELCDQHARQAIDPAGPGHAEPIGKEGGDGTRTAEHEDQRKADHEWRRDDRQDAQDAQGRLVPEVRAGCDERKGKAEAGRPDADQKCQEERVPGDPAAQIRVDAVQSPDRQVEELCCKLAERDVALVVLDRAQKDRRNGKEDEDRNECDDGPDRRHDECVAPAPSPGGKPMANHHEKCRRRQGRAEAHPALARSGAAEPRGEEVERPAVEADREALSDRQGKPQRARDDEPGRDAPEWR